MPLALTGPSYVVLRAAAGRPPPLPRVVLGPREQGRVRAAAAPSPLLEPRCAGVRPLGLLATRPGQRGLRQPARPAQSTWVPPGLMPCSGPPAILGFGLHVHSHPRAVTGWTGHCSWAELWPGHGQCPLTEPSSRAGAEDAVPRKPLTTVRPAGCRWTGSSVCFVLYPSVPVGLGWALLPHVLRFGRA